MIKPTLFLSIFITFLSGFFHVTKGQETLSQKLGKANSLIYSNPEKAIQLGNEVYEKSNDQKLKLSALIMLGTAYSEKSDVDKSIEVLLKAETLAESEKDYVNEVRALSLLGYQYQILQITQKTHAYLDQAEEVIRTHGLPDSLMYLRGNNYSIKALTYQQTLDCGYAIDYFNKAISVYKRLKDNDVSKINLNIAYLNKASCFLENKNTDSAKVALAEGDRILKSLDATDDLLISQDIAWAKYYYETKDYHQSLKILNANLEKAKEMSQFWVNNEIYHLLSQNYLALNDIEKYNHFSNLYVETQKKVSEAEKNSISHIINQPPENKAQGSVSRSKIVYLISGILGVILVLIILFSVKSFRLKRKIKDMKSGQNQES